MMPVALFGITNDALSLVVNLLLLFLAVLWLALIAWTYFDARRRIADRVLVACATAASLFPFVGTIVYSILRPPEFLADKRERELEIRASELRVRQLEEASCPNCEHPVERTFLRCPNCRARIKDPCESCGKPIDPRWSVCPYCESPVRRAVTPERRVQTKRRAKEPSRQPSRSARPAGSGSSGSGSRSSGSGGRPQGAESSSRQESGPRPSSGSRPAPSAAPAPADGRATSRPAGEPTRQSSSSHTSRAPSRTTQQRATSTREPKRGE
ncbi:MAG: hypothetical protein GEU88_08970 [Solirubrobacterales bacterium]|nr:hypothetical protein [Solirubrobacterales bacterium]